MKQWTDKQIIDYIQDIRNSIQNDVGIALKGYSNEFFEKKVSAGFFAVPRMLFPEIDGLGSYITGKPSATVKNIKAYFSEVLSTIDSRYNKYGGFIGKVYRNGLLHQHSPKKFNYKNKEIGWWFSISGINNPIEVQRKYHLELFQNVLQIDMNVFYTDVVQSLSIIQSLILGKYRQMFHKSAKKQYKPLTKTSVLREQNKKNPILNNDDFKFLTKI